jgi:3-hydroxybutyryl-CoA dehydrogenase
LEFREDYMNLKSRITIIGAGTMGHGLALVFARGGNTVFLTDNMDGALKQAMQLIRSHLETLADCNELEESPDKIIDRIVTFDDYKTACRESDLVIEAIIEDMEAKRRLFHEIAECIGDRTIVSSNTSALNIFALCPVSLQKKLLITHFFNPPYIIPLVEIVGSSEIDSTILPSICDFLKSLGMITVTMKKFIPGFIVNRLQRALRREVLHMIDEGFADPEEIDRAVKASLGIRLPILGVVAQNDYTGLDMAVRSLKAPPLGLASEDKLSPTLLKLVKLGHLGVKSGKGFFDYSGKPLNEILRERDVKLIQHRRMLQKMGEIH